ncbi:MAG: hypothetical protein JNG82_12935 [Opitutaceae bacterium]|nr:hypothetical protein [Opitutaceae bacterium]
MKRFRWITVLIASGGLLLAGCGKKASETTAHTEEGEEGGGGVSFKEGRGLALNPDVIRALGLKTAEAEERPLSAEMKLLAQVFATSPQVLASASVPEAEADRLEKQSFTGAKLVRVDRTSVTATRRVDAIFTVERSPAPQFGDFVELALAGEPRSALAVPRSAILDAATGTFVYVVNGENYLRTPVKIDARSGDFVEITDGLYAGDVVVTTPVNQLWLSELRLTKGGGHSH